jgi:photosystem II stability/assembly factor-like uncharacterized protein
LPEKGNAFFFINNNLGWFASDNRIYRQTENNQWEIQYQIDPKNSIYRIKDIFFINDHIGWVAYSVDWFSEDTGGNAVVLFYTDNGGLNWRKSVSHNIWVNSIFFIDELTGFLCGYYLMKTTDGGISWERTSIENPTKSFFIDQMNGWTIHKNGYGLYSINMISSTHDGGSIWETYDLNYEFNSLFFLNKMIGWVIGDGGFILKYDNDH